MSWFQSANIASFAKTALKEAQKTIDKALDIQEEDGQAAASNANGNEGRGAGVSTAVTDMASDFFASWGVTGGVTSTSTSKKGTVKSSNNGSPMKTRAISTPPKKSSKVHDLAPVENDSSGLENLSSDVPVTLLASSENDWNDTEIFRSISSADNVDHCSDISNKHKHHTRSLSDTVFHAADDSASNLGGLVQVLDDNSSVLLDPISFTSTERTSTTPKVETVGLLVGKSDCNLVSESGNSSLESKATTASVKASDSISFNDNLGTNSGSGPSNLELLQEIDLDGGSGVVEQTISKDDLPSSKFNAVESSALSDGWDWTVSTDSCLLGEKIVSTEDQEPAENNEPHEEKKEANPENKTISDSTGDLLETSAETLKPESEKTEIENENLAVSCVLEEPYPEQTSKADLVEQNQSLSSRPTSPTDNEVGLGGSTSPSSARVSPNFEMVSGGVCVVSSSGGTLPESSRSSSIVVVSGRESTPNSRGTSGAGSSGSSEGGHDIVDGEIPHSPAVTLSTGDEFPRRFTKHKKGASSSSSSDIEVIPSDYSSSSAVLPNPPHIKERSSLSNLQKRTCNDKECQTERQVQYVECQVQTEEVIDSASASSVDKSSVDISKFVSDEVADILAEKEQEVLQLREEGEKLSVKQFELSQVIKKLRAKEKETEGVIKGLRAEIATKNLELEKLMKTFISKEGIEQSQNDTISKLNQERRKLELKVEELTSDLEDARDNVESMKATVENASIEILELKNVISSVQRESAEVDRLTKDKAQLISRSESLQKEVDHLRSVLNSSQSTHHTREAELKSQISSLTQKVHHLETSLGDISSEVADATMPLSMEIEKLQAELKQQLAQSDRREHVMQSTIADLEMKLRTASDKEKSAKDLQIHYQSQHSTLELRIEELEAKNRSLVEQLHQKEEIFGKKMEDRVARCQKLEKTVERLTGEVERLSNENDALSNELKAERTSLEVEKRRISQGFVMTETPAGSSSNNNFHQHQQQPRPQNQIHHQRSSSMSTTASSTGGSNRGTIRNDNSPRSREHSPSEHSVTSEEASYLDEVFDPNSGMMIGGNRSMTPKSFFESFSSAGLIENLQSQLRQREGEVMAFQEELSKNERIRKQLNEEIANLTMQNQQLAMEMEKLGEMEQKLEEVDKNYNAVLQMYGEKVEEADELRMDLEDVKEMYKAQIETLLKKS